MVSAPFRQLPFEEVPEHPTVPHHWAKTTRRDVTIEHEGLPPTRIAVREYGSGPPLVLVHGLMTAGYSFRYLLDLLGAHHRLLIPDRPGAARASTPTSTSPRRPRALGDRDDRRPMIRLDDASHFAHVDAAPRFVAAIEPFLSASR